ncbi:Periplasmic serine endoprotease DegP [subsurface metagenome]
MAKHAYEQLVKGGTVERGYLGVKIEDLTDETAPFFGLKKNAKGALISEVVEDSAADKAGLRHNDVVVELNGEPVESRDAFRNQVAMLKPGSRINLVDRRDRKRKALTVKLGKRPPMEEITGDLSPETINELGFTVQDLTPDLVERYGYEGQSGVIVSDVESGSQAAQKGIAPGALIKEVNQQEVRNTREFNEAIKEARKEGGALLLVKWRRYTLYIPLKLSEK